MKWRGHAILISVFCVPLALGCDDQDKAPGQTASRPSVVRPENMTAEKIESALAAAEEYLRADDVAKAQAILLRLIERAPREVRARELYGQTLTLAAMQAERRKDSASAARALRRQAYDQYKAALELDPKSAGLHQSAGLMAMGAGEDQAALSHFQDAAELEPDNPQYPLFAAQLLIKRKDLDAARLALRRVLTLDPDEAVAHASLAMIALELNEFDEAFEHIAEARRIQPDDLGFRAQQARIHRRTGNPHRALELLVGLSDQERAQEVAAYEIAASYEVLGEHVLSAQAWRHCFRINPTGAKAWLAAVRAGEALLKAGQREQASAWLQQAQLAAPDAPEVKALEQALAAD